jgi:hypothetical protein
VHYGTGRAQGVCRAFPTLIRSFVGAAGASSNVTLTSASRPWACRPGGTPLRATDSSGSVSRSTRLVRTRAGSGGWR